MPVVVNHRKRPEQPLLLLGAGYGKWAHSHAHPKYSIFPSVKDSSERGVLFVCDERGEIGLLALDYADVLSVDGRPPLDAMDGASSSATVLEASDGSRSLFLGAGVARWAHSTKEGVEPKLAELRGGQLEWRDAEEARVVSIAGGAPEQAFARPAERGRPAPLVVEHAQDGVRYLVLDAGLGVSRRAGSSSILGLELPVGRAVTRSLFGCDARGRARWLPFEELSVVSAGNTSLPDVLSDPHARGVTRLTEKRSGGHCFLVGTVYAESAYAYAGMKSFGERPVRSDKDEVAAVAVCNHRGAVRMLPAEQLCVTRIAGVTPGQVLAQRGGSGYR